MPWVGGGGRGSTWPACSTSNCGKPSAVADSEGFAELIFEGSMSFWRGDSSVRVGLEFSASGSCFACKPRGEVKELLREFASSGEKGRKKLHWVVTVALGVLIVGNG